MLQALLASGALFQGIKAEASAKLQRFAFMLACAVVALIFLSVGLLALAAAAYFALIPHLGEIGAASMVGGVAILIAAILIAVGTHDRSAKAVTRKTPATSADDSPLPGISEAVGAAPAPWLLGALALGLFLARKR
jgi:hypothetical protein